MNTERVLVTGGAGFIGSFLVDYLVEKGSRVTILDNLDPQVHPKGIPEYLNKDVEFIRGDVRNRDLLAWLLSRNEVVYHLAGAVGVGQSQYQIEHYVDVNTRGTATLLDVLVNTGHVVHKVIVAASMSSYGEGRYLCPGDEKFYRPPLRSEEQMRKGDWELCCPQCGQAMQPVPTPECEPFHCNSIYSMTKAHQEEMTLLIGRTYSIPAVAMRFFNVFGPRQSLSNPYTGVAAIFMSRIKNDNSPVVYEDGNQTRDFISVHDLVHGLYLAKESAAADYESFNLGSSNPLTIQEVARAIARVCGKSIEPNITCQFRKGDVRHCFADITKARTLLGWEPTVSFSEGIRELVEWSKETEAVDQFEKAAQELKAKGLA
jgi:dTDP-L-rhamnose 4-epimerase